MTARAVLAFLLALAPSLLDAGSVPVRARNGMVVSQNAIASQTGMEVLMAGGNAVDAAVATAFALAVVHPAAGNIGGGGFLLVRPAKGPAALYDFREQAPAGATPTMFLRDGRYSEILHHRSHLSAGVPGSVAGLHMAHIDHGHLPWKELVQPAIALARDGFMVSDGLARSLREVLPQMKSYPASIAQFSRQGVPFEAGDLLQQPDLAKTLERIAERGARGFYDGETAALVEKEMKANGGLVTREDLRRYDIYRRPPLRGSYRGAEILTVPPPSSGGVVLLECLNVLEDENVPEMGFNSARYVHHVTEALRRAFADRARWLGDPAFVKDMPVERLVSKEYAALLRRTIREDRASVSTPTTFEWPAESPQTTHLSVVDQDRNAVALTTTLEDGYGSKIVVPGAGFLLNNEMGDFNAGPGLTDDTGLIGTEPNLAGPGKRMLSSMTPTIVVKGGQPFLVAGSPGGRTIPSTVLQVLLDVLDFGMNPQEAVDAPRFHHQWLPDVIQYERHGLSADTTEALAAKGHRLREIASQGVAETILVDPREGTLEGGCDRRAPDGAAIGR
ncbi:MAG TPA: gamma-glutamyltransferase [Vicinamibacteria bacterium]|nr:gamma-glutamyltransferase [Vicinamibacteria bacterium]